MYFPVPLSDIGSNAAANTLACSFSERVVDEMIVNQSTQFI